MSVREVQNVIEHRFKAAKHPQLFLRKNSQYKDEVFDNFTLKHPGSSVEMYGL